MGRGRLGRNGHLEMARGEVGPLGAGADAVRGDGSRPVLLGIAGDSAAGKTTLAMAVADLLGRDRVTHLCTDDYHKYDRAERAQLGISASDPDGNYLDILELHLERLHYGEPILKPVYEHAGGTLMRPEYVRPAEFVIVEGLLCFHTPVMRQFYDVKVYLDTPEELRRAWKLRRDTTRRGYTPEQVLAELAAREGDSQRYVRPQRDDADLVVGFRTAAGSRPEDPDAPLDVRWILRPTIPHPELSPLFERGAGALRSVRLELGRDGGRPADILEIEDGIAPEEVARLEAVIRERTPELEPPRRDGSGEDAATAGTSGLRGGAAPTLTRLLLACQLLRQAAGPRRPFARPVAALSRLRPSTHSSPS